MTFHPREAAAGHTSKILSTLTQSSQQSPSILKFSSHFRQLGAAITRHRKGKEIAVCVVRTLMCMCVYSEMCACRMHAMTCWLSALGTLDSSRHDMQAVCISVQSKHYPPRRVMDRARTDQFHSCSSFWASCSHLPSKHFTCLWKHVHLMIDGRGFLPAAVCSGYSIHPEACRFAIATPSTGK
eukprot:1147544-Pelagomonas_calceolata.AAC.3